MGKDEKLSGVEKLLEEANDENTPNAELIDIDSINIVDGTISDQQADIKNIFGSKPSVQVVCAQSGYMCKISSLIYKDIFNMTNSNLSNYESKREIYRTVYSKITGYSAPKWHPSFDEWLKVTSFADLETLFYGIYCATFQEKSKITYECPVCGEQNTIEITNSQLVHVADREEMGRLSDSISREADSVEKIKEFSLVADKKENTTTIRLPDSKLIFSLKLPTLNDVLEFLRKFTDEEVAKCSSATVNMLLCTKLALLPDTSADAKENSYTRIKDIKDVYNLLNILSIDDYDMLKKVVTKMIGDKHITYEIKNQKCESCATAIPHIPLNIEDLLFFQISERQL